MGHKFSRSPGFIKDEGIWGNFSKILEELSQVKQNLNINAQQCRYMRSKMVKLLHALQRDQSPAAQEFHGIVTRALKLVGECCTETWLLKAVEIGDCPEHFVELHLDLYWSYNVLSLAGQGIQWDQTSISEVHEFRDEDKKSLISKVKEVLEGRNTHHGISDVDQQLASILIGRNEGCSASATPVPGLEEFVKKWIFNTNEDTIQPQGKGGSCFVVKYRWDCVEKDFVLKLAIDRSEEVDMIKEEVGIFKKEDDIIKKEADIMEKCRHPYVVGVVGCWEIDSRSVMMMESMKCTLRELMKRSRTSSGREGFSPSEAIELVLPVAKALRYLHGKEKPIAHRDIKPDNIMRTKSWFLGRGKRPRNSRLLGQRVPAPTRWTAPRLPRGSWAVRQWEQASMGAGSKESEDVTKLIDFGDSKEYYLGDTTRTYGVAGTTGYMDPQVKFKGNSEHCDLLKADVFSFGMVFAELLTWKTPTEALSAQAKKSLNGNQVHAFLRLGGRPHVPHVPLSPDGGNTTQLPHHIPIYVAFIVESCWRKIPSMRPGFEDICSMLQNAQFLLKKKEFAKEEAFSMVSYESDGDEWPIPGKFTLREMLCLDEETDINGRFDDFIKSKLRLDEFEKSRGIQF